MRFLIVGLILLEVVSCLSILETFLRLISGRPIVRELKDFPRCGRPTTIKSGLTLLEAKRTRGQQRGATSQNQRRVEGPNRNYEKTRNHESIQQCSITNKCGYGEGHCESDDECLLAFQCGFNNCQAFNPSANSWEDCCIFRTSDNLIDEAASANQALADHGDVNINTQKGIQSENFPMNYTNNTIVTWSVRPRYNNQYVTVIIHYLNLEYARDCVYDSLRIIDPSYGNQTLNLFCGFLEDYKPLNFYTPSNRDIRLTFQTDRSVTAQGFVIEFF